MLNAEKIRLMTDLAIYEKQNAKTVFQINSYYKEDYIAGQLLSAFMRYSLCFLLVFCAYLLFHLDSFFYNINLRGVTETMNLVGILYGAGLLLYLLIAFLLAKKRYEMARRGILLYAAKLKRLSRKEDRAALEREHLQEMQEQESKQKCAGRQSKAALLGNRQRFSESKRNE